MACCWTETVLSEHQFQHALQDESFWDGGTTAAQALVAASDFLSLAKQSCPTVVVVLEGYHKLQSAALDRQLPQELRAVDLKGLPPPAQLYWQPSSNLLHPLQLLSRELTGCAAACTPRQPCKGPVGQLEQVPFAAIERCQLLEVQYVLKELRQQQPPTQAQDADGQPQQQRQPTAAAAQQPEHQQVWGAAVAGAPAQMQPLVGRLTIRVLLQRLPAAHAPDELLDEQEVFGDSSWQQRGLQGYGQTQQVAYTCQLEYPAFNLQSSDYIIPVQLFDEGLSAWQALQKGEAFSMSWDGTPWRGFAQGYRRRGPGDQFLGSPWWSIAVEWEGHSTDRKKDPEDWCYGNPWEMTRERTTGPPKLPDLQTALKTANKAGHPVLAAPWTAVGMAAAAAVRAPTKRKRQVHHHHDDDFVYDDGADEDTAEQQQDADVWDPTDFYYDDDPQDFELDANEHVQPRRKSARQHSSSGRWRNSSRHASPGAGADGACCIGRGHKAAEAPGELTHNYGRQLLARTDLCLVCGSSEGTLISGHAGRGGNCERQYHRGCMLLLNAVGMRSVTLNSKAAAPQQRKRTAAGRDSPSQPPLPPAELAEALCDGLLGLLWQQCQQAGHGLSAAVVAAVAAARTAAYRVAVGELVLICPSHGCHGCRLNGKLEFMVWCCCCWVRTYHHRQCVPIGADHVQLDGRDFIRCPHCKAAGVPVPGAALAPAATAGGGVEEPVVLLVPEQGMAGAEAAAGADTGGQPMAVTTPAAASDDSAAQSDQQGPTLEQPEPNNLLQQQQQQRRRQQRRQTSFSTDTLQEPFDDAADGPAAACSGELQQPDIIELLDSSEPGEGPECITIDSSEDEEQQQQQRQRSGTQQARALEQEQQAQTSSSGDDEDAAGAEGDIHLLAAVADLDAQLQALQQHGQQQQLARAPAGAEGAGASARGAAMHASAMLGTGAAAAQAEQRVQGPRIPPWLQLSFEDVERVRPSYVLAPCAAPDGASTSRGSSSAGETANVIAAAAAAAGTLPPAAGAAAFAAADFAGAAAGGEWQPGSSNPADGAADAAGGLPLASPHSHWLIGCLAKAEAQYKPANVWGCAMIGVPLYPDDSVYGLAVVLDYLPALQQQQQQQQQQRVPGTAAVAAGGAAQARVRPAVYLRCSKNVSQSGKLQPAMWAHDDDEAKRAREWQVLVNGRPYPIRQGKNGMPLHVGDVVTVQGLHFKLQLSS